MISLIGEQPIPNLLPIRYLKPENVLLLYTDRTQLICKNLEKLMTTNKAYPLPIEPYDIRAITQELERIIQQNRWHTNTNDILFNLTGGTKPMAFAAFRVAEHLGSPFVYLQSEGRKSILYWYKFSPGTGFVFENKEEISELITIDDYLKAHGLWSYTSRSLKRNLFEKLVERAMKKAVQNNRISEIKPSVSSGALQIDLMIRCKNQIGVAEIKLGQAAQSIIGINQLNTASEQRFLGTYVVKFLILDRQLDSNNQALAEAHRITTVVLSHRAGQSSLSPENEEKVIRIVQEKLGA
jgi:hypothetical protein